MGSATRLVLISALLAAVLAGAATLGVPGANAARERPAYGWPLKPCDRQHAVRGHLGAPRTIFAQPLGARGLDGPGRVSFHNGIDIVAEAGKAVYPVVSGVVRRISGGLAVITEDQREFRYQHITRVARPGQHVVACRTVLGFVQERKEHLHFVEVDRGKVVNPLKNGRLLPHADATKPRVEAVRLVGDAGIDLTATEIDRRGAARAFRDGGSPVALRGRVRIGAEAYDVPAIPIEWPREWAEMSLIPLVPTRLELTLRPARSSRIALRLRSRANFRETVPTNEAFWRIYRRGTHQNWPVIGGRWHKRMPGAYLFRLPRLDTTRLPNGRYALKVTAYDARGNRGWLRLWVQIRN